MIEAARAGAQTPPLRKFPGLLPHEAPPLGSFGIYATATEDILDRGLRPKDVWTIRVGLHWKDTGLGRLTVMWRGPAAAYEWIRPLS